MYGTDTIPVQNAPGAEYVTVQDGRITYMRIDFDRTPSTRPAALRGSCQARCRLASYAR